ncbi:MAG: 16S rRNA (guanine(966)-N(2))-methyltransferase RsmD [Bacilli bacterium]|nr:16S rRNA (guanine(966)-N(2))-methyltransferase RsmD [Bacilli bacterium]MBN2876681.1 16S rRNA (guanine(966)-N(2))-methyltransferase RsmD [Bacilli bacterium]
MLRIVGGEFRSRRIKEVASDQVRPTTDRNKEAVFNILGQFFNGGRCLDLFAGSGSLGLEAISRGFSHVDFVDSFAPSIQTIKENILTLQVETQTSVRKDDCLNYLKSCKTIYDLILADPPYKLDKYEELLSLINGGHLLASNGIIVFEADKKQSLPMQSGNLVLTREKVFGNTKFGFYEMREEE